MPGNHQLPEIITLTTDFGTADHFAGSMKGVILGIAPLSTIVDITHEIKPFAIEEAGFSIAQAYRYFPKKTVHVVVVDPGVGSARRPVLIEAAGQYFVGPDNGVFSMICAAEKQHSAILIASSDSRVVPCGNVVGPLLFRPVEQGAQFKIAIASYARIWRSSPQVFSRERFDDGLDELRP